MSGAAAFGNIFKIPELKKRVLFTLGILIVYRIGAHIPTPGINSAALAELFEQARRGAAWPNRFQGSSPKAR